MQDYARRNSQLCNNRGMLERIKTFKQQLSSYDEALVTNVAHLKAKK